MTWPRLVPFPRPSAERRSAAAIIRDAVHTYLAAHADKPVGLLRLPGIGKDIWADEDAAGYIDRLREDRPWSPNGSHIYLDTAPLIYTLEEHPAFGRPVANVLDAIDDRRLRATTSALTIAEILVKPFERGRDDAAATLANVDAFLTNDADLRRCQDVNTILVSELD